MCRVSTLHGTTRIFSRQKKGQGAAGHTGINDDIVNVAMALDAGCGSASGGPAFAPATPAFPSGQRIVSHGIPFFGDYSGVIWNTQGLFHSNASNQGKMELCGNTYVEEGFWFSERDPQHACMHSCSRNSAPAVRFPRILVAWVFQTGA